MAGELVWLRTNQQAAIIGYQKSARLRRIVQMQFANRQIAGQSARQRNEAMTLLDGAGGVADQNAQAIAWVR